MLLCILVIVALLVGFIWTRAVNDMQLIFSLLVVSVVYTVCMNF